PRRLGGEPTVLGGGRVPDLPRAVHLVAQAPQLDAERVRAAVGPAQVGVLRATGVVGVLQDVAGLLDAAGAEVDRHHRLGARRLRPAGELAETELVGLDRAPGPVEPARPLLLRADPVLPVVAGDEVAAGVAHDGGAELA